MVERLFGHIEDDTERREREQDVHKILAEFSELTVLTNAYHNKDIDKHILQLTTYKDGDLYGAEVVVPRSEDEELPMFTRMIESTLRAMEEKLAEDEN